MLAKTELDLTADLDNDTFLEWLRQQPPDEEYCYLDHGKCLVATYFQSRGYQDVIVYSNPSVKIYGKSYTYPRVWNTIALQGSYNNHRTYGTALRIAEKLLKHAA